MKEVAVYQAKTQLSELLAAVERGEQFTITRRGLPIARLVSAGKVKGNSRARQAQSVATIFGAMERNRKGVTLEGSLKGFVDEDRG